MVTFLLRQLERIHARRLLAWLRSKWSLPLGIALAWFVFAYVSIYFAEGFRPKAFMTPDEAANRFASSIISKTGRPFLELPFIDPEDSAHPRAWLSQGDYAIPIYPPVPIYFYALLTYLRRVGSIALIALPASALGAFAAGVARLLPNNRRWLAAFAPALGMPALYWLLRPWMNICALLTCVCWAFYCWTRWHTGGSKHWLTGSLLFVGLGAAVRPDYTAYLLLLVLLTSFGARPSIWRRLMVLTVVAGGLAFACNLFFNHLITGHAFRAAYQMAMDADPGGPKKNPLVRFIELLFFPLTFPGWKVVGGLFFKYWLGLQPLWLLTLGQFALVPILRRQEPRRRLASLAALLLLVLFMLSRVTPALFGFGRDEGWVQDSIPRYWSPVFLLAALPPLLFLARTQQRKTFIVGTVLLSLLAAGNVFEVFWRSSQSMWRHRVIATHETEWLDQLRNIIPSDAMVYSPVYDKVLWSRFRTGSLEDLDVGADSMRRALAHDLSVYVWVHPSFKWQVHTLERILARRGLMLVLIDKTLRVYRVIARPS